MHSQSQRSWSYRSTGIRSLGLPRRVWKSSAVSWRTEIKRLAVMERHVDFEHLLKQLAGAIETGNAAALAACFTPDGIYEDYFFGPKQGPQGLREMLDHFYAGGRNFKWEFVQPVCSGDLGYASYRFSYESLQPQTLGRRVGFDGISCIELRDGLISHYREVFDRSMALVQQDFAPERIARIISKHSGALRQKAEWAAHFLSES